MTPEQLLSMMDSASGCERLDNQNVSNVMALGVNCVSLGQDATDSLIEKTMADQMPYPQPDAVSTLKGDLGLNNIIEQGNSDFKVPGIDQ